MTDDDSDRKFIVFLDSWGTNDLEQMPWAQENLSLGEMDSGKIYVTPTVLGSVYTGTNPGEHGMPRVSATASIPLADPRD